FDLPEARDTDDLRRLLLRVYALHERRATPFGIREFIQLYTGIRPGIYEAFEERRVWSLGYTSALGFDTALADAAASGMILPGQTTADPKYSGLRGDYYTGIDFNQFKFMRLDPRVNFDWTATPPIPTTPEKFSVRWTGQIQPQYSEIYTFYTLSDD